MQVSSPSIWQEESITVWDILPTINDVAPGVAVHAPGIDLLHIPAQHQSTAATNCPIQAAAASCAATRVAAFHVPCKAFALCDELLRLQAAPHSSARLCTSD